MHDGANIIEVRGLSKKFGASRVLHGIDFSVPSGRIYGLIGHNGAGKTTAINAILGLTDYEGDVSVLGREPYRNRPELMKDVAFISDVASLPRFLRVSELLDLMVHLHPNFVLARAAELIADTDIRLSSRIRTLSKGMMAQLHLAIVMAINARLLVLDEPTLGLDITFRKRFYRRLVEDYMDENRSILITTHQVDEIEFLLTNLIFLRKGRIVLDEDMDQIASRFTQIVVSPDMVAAAEAENPVFRAVQLGQNIMIFDGLDAAKAREFGHVTTPSVSDLFVALMEKPNSESGVEK